MKYDELNESQKIGLKVLKAVQAKCSTRFNAFVPKKLNLAYQASLITSDYEDIATKVRFLMNSMDLVSALEKYIKEHGNIEVKAIQQNLLFKENKNEIGNLGNLGNTLGLLEKVLAEVIVREQGETIKKEIFADFQKQAKEFIEQNYGVIQRKVEVQVGEIKTQFNQVLHEKFETVLNFVRMDEPVFLTGGAGSGKNVLCEQVAKALGLDFYFTNAITQTYELTGFTDAMGIYHQTQFYEAFTKGGLFMLDEMDASIPDVLVKLNMAIANREFDFPQGKDINGNLVGGKVKAHSDFRVVSAGNTFGLGADYEYVGRNQLDGASLDRFAIVEIDYDKNIEMNVARGDKELVDFVEDLRRTANESGIRMIISYRGIGRIAKMKNVLSLKETLKTCLVKNLRADDVSTLVSGSKLPSENQYLKTLKELIA